MKLHNHYPYYHYKHDKHLRSEISKLLTNPIMQSAAFFIKRGETPSIQCGVSGLVSRSLRAPSSRLGRRYIFVRLAVCLSISGNKLEIVRQVWGL